MHTSSEPSTSSPPKSFLQYIKDNIVVMKGENNVLIEEDCKVLTSKAYLCGDAHHREKNRITNQDGRGRRYKQEPLKLKSDNTQHILIALNLAATCTRAGRPDERSKSAPQAVQPVSCHFKRS